MGMVFIINKPSIFDVIVIRILGAKIPSFYIIFLNVIKDERNST